MFSNFVLAAASSLITSVTPVPGAQATIPYDVTSQEADDPLICSQIETIACDNEISLSSGVFLPGLDPEREMPLEEPQEEPVVVKNPAPVVATSYVSYNPEQGDLSADTVFDIVNQYRISAGLPAFEKDPLLCQIAESRKPELSNEMYGTSYIHAGMRNRALPYWVTENMVKQNSEASVVNWWLGSPVHRSAIYSDKQYSCAACANNICIQLFTSFEPK